ncbi:MAG: LPS export ABC transporter permease LptF [Rhodobacteraceae bacterium]|nr:LPS export ABC transporter permease LptF [Paracoccaceae bacterium]
MTTLERYVLRQMLGPFGFFVLVLTGIVWLMLSLKVINIVVNNGQGAKVFLEFTALLLPMVLSIVLQLSALAASVYALHRLMMESEIIAAFAAGASQLRMSRPVAIFGLGLAAVLAVDTLYLMPTAARQMRDRVAEVRSDVAAGFIRDGRFLHPARGLTVYIREITSQGELRGVMVQDARDRARPVTYTAKSGFLTRVDDRPALVMFEGQAQRFEQGGERLSLLRFDSLAYDLSHFVSSDSVRTRKASERFFWELINPDPTVAKSEKARGKFIAEGHEQLSAPIYAVTLPMLAAAILFGGAFSRRGFGARVAAALVCGALVRIIGLGAKSATTGEPALWPLMYAVPIGGILIAMWMMSRERWRAGPTKRRDVDDDGDLSAGDPPPSTNPHGWEPARA